MDDVIFMLQGKTSENEAQSKTDPLGGHEQRWANTHILVQKGKLHFQSFSGHSRTFYIPPPLSEPALGLKKTPLKTESVLQGSEGEQK